MDFKSISKLLQYGIFTIPDYQRGYSWGNEQLTEFLEDLEDVENIKEHYTGTITVIKSGEEKVGITTYTKFDLVDGQQRLITIHILLSCLHHMLVKLDKEEDDIMRNVIYKGKTLLRLNNTKNQEFFEYILTNDINNSTEVQNKTQKNLLNTKVFFNKIFSSKKSTKLFSYYNNLVSKFKVNIFELETEAEVGLIFETMNDRGLSLSDIDKIKNYLIYLSHRLADDKLAKDINRRFGDIFKELMKVQGNSNVTKTENLFLKNSYIIYQGKSKDLNDIHKKVKKLISKKFIFKKQRNLWEKEETNSVLKDKKIGEIKEFTSFLVKSSKEYSKILNQTFADDLVNEGLFRLKILDKLDKFIPILLAIASNKKFKTEYLKTVINLLEIYAVRVFFIANKNSQTGITELQKIAYNIRKNKTNFTNVKKEIRLLISKNVTNNEFKNAIIRNAFYNNNRIKPDLIKYFLYEYEIHRENENKSNFRMPEIRDFFNLHKEFSIEHIFPQNQTVGDRIDVTDIHLLGNLVLTKNNNLLTNKLFLDKKPIFLTSELTSENDISKFENWDNKSITERGKTLAKFAQTKWKI